jgi:hypothetical protein
MSNLAFAYKLGGIDRDIRHIYIRPHFYRTLRCFKWFLRDIDDLSKLCSGVSEIKLTSTIATAHSFYDLAFVLSNWSYLDEQRLDLLHSSMTALVSILRDRLRECTKESANQSLYFENPFKVKKIASQFKGYADATSLSFDDDLRTTCSFVNDTASCSAEILSTGSFVVSGAVNDLIALSPSCFEVQGEKRIQFEKDLFDNWPGSVMIVGQAGSGKTSFCRWHALRDCERFSTGSSRIMPVYVPLKEFNDRTITTFQESFLVGLGRSALLARREDGALQDWDVVRVYLDGLDELSSVEQQQKVLRAAETALNEVESLQLILAARDYDYGRLARWLPKICIAEFDEEQISQLVIKWLDSVDANIQRFYEQLSATPALRELMKVPLLATLVILVFRQTHKLPENRSRLYEMFVDLLAGGWDLVKGVQRQSVFEARDKVLVLARLAWDVHSAGRRQFGQDDVGVALDRILSRRLRRFEEKLLEELLRDGLIMRSGDLLEFSHSSFQEFLTARGLVGEPLGRNISRSLNEFLRGGDWWREVLCYYMSLSGRPTALLGWLNRGVWEVTSGASADVKARANEQHSVLVKALRAYYPHLRIDGEE